MCPVPQWHVETINYVPCTPVAVAGSKRPEDRVLAPAPLLLSLTAQFRLCSRMRLEYSRNPRDHNCRSPCFFPLKSSSAEEKQGEGRGHERVRENVMHERGGVLVHFAFYAGSGTISLQDIFRQFVDPLLGSKGREDLHYSGCYCRVQDICLPPPAAHRFSPPLPSPHPPLLQIYDFLAA